MQQVILAIALLISSLIFAQKETELKDESITITATVVNALNDTGEIRFALYTKENFMKQPLFHQSAIIEEGKSTVTFTNIPKGIYAVTCYHDENDNKQMDFFENGMPKESYGSSNNPLNFGPPDFESSKFEVSNKDIILEIKF
ncbi:DUF2141 domain-containing protein [Lutibacter sp. B1]|uniref:DUF2141 domain-containing protein n=1 Tax=Lutibacter sp. B1 TaxID=2725996 RepID=UPI0014568887|nr:DUF2141 domain-containing protein [Lutibacter sp. B1]NLP57961.1 DUF2141 domain-containing protein [Lutibacter sp. B1]